MTDDARVREIASIIGLQDMGPGVSLGSRLAAGMFDYYPKDSQGREDARKCVTWAINQVSRAIAALPVQGMTEEERTYVEKAKAQYHICRVEGQDPASDKIWRLLAIIDRFAASGDHQSSTSARDAALDDVRAMVCKEWHHVVKKFKLLPGTELENVFGTIISGIDAMKGAPTSGESS